MALLKYIWWMYHNPSIFLLTDICSASKFFHMQKCAALKVFCLPPPILHPWQYPYSIYADEDVICGILCSSSNIFEPVMKVKVSCLTLCEHGLYVAHQAPCLRDSQGKNTAGGCHFLLQGIFPTQGSNPDFQHWRQILYPLRYPRKPKSESCLTVSDSLWPHGLYNLFHSPDQNTGVGSLSLIQGIFPTHGSNPGPPHCRQILYHLSHKGSPKILEGVAYPFASDSSQPRNWIGNSCIAGRFFTNSTVREAWDCYISTKKCTNYPT